MVSMGGWSPTPYAAAYTASKFGLRGFSASLREELRDRPGIRVSAVFPALVDTPGFLHGANMSGRALDPGGPFIAPEEVARVMVDLALEPRDEVAVGWAGQRGAGGLRAGAEHHGARDRRRDAALPPQRAAGAAQRGRAAGAGAGRHDGQRRLAGAAARPRRAGLRRPAAPRAGGLGAGGPRPDTRRGAAGRAAALVFRRGSERTSDKPSAPPTGGRHRRGRKRHGARPGRFRGGLRRPRGARRAGDDDAARGRGRAARARAGRRGRPLGQPSGLHRDRRGLERRVPRRVPRRDAAADRGTVLRGAGRARSTAAPRRPGRRSCCSRRRPSRTGGGPVSAGPRSFTEASPTCRASHRPQAAEWVFGAGG